MFTWFNNRRVGIKAAIIGGLFVIIAAFIGGVFALVVARGETTVVVRFAPTNTPIGTPTTQLPLSTSISTSASTVSIPVPRSNTSILTITPISTTSIPTQSTTPTLLGLLPKPTSTKTPASILMANIVSQTGEQFQIPAKFLLYEPPLRGLQEGLPLTNEEVYFSDMEKFEISGDQYGPITATITLLDDQVIVDQLAYSPGMLSGPISLGKLNLHIHEVRRVEFLLSTSEIYIPMAHVTLLDGTTTQIPEYCLEAAWHSGGTPEWFNELHLSSGQRIPFKKIESFEISNPSDLEVTIVMVDGNVINANISYGYGIRGPTEIGPFWVSFEKLKRIRI